MKTPSALASCIVPPAAARVLHAFGDEVTFLLDGTMTGGKFTMFTCVTPPGGGPPPHYHQAEDEWFLLLEGRAEFLRDGAWSEVALGTAVFMPRGSVHSFRNPGTEPMKLLIHTAPSGFEHFFSRCAEEFAQPAGPEMARLLEIAAEHGIGFPAPPAE